MIPVQDGRFSHHSTSKIHTVALAPIVYERYQPFDYCLRVLLVGSQVQ
jgi:hypothetical protein